MKKKAFTICIALVFLVGFWVYGTLPREDEHAHAQEYITQLQEDCLINKDEQPPTIRYEVKYGNTTIILYDPIVENPTEPLGSMEERAIEVVKKEYGNTLPDGFEKDIKIAKIIN